MGHARSGAPHERAPNSVPSPSSKALMFAPSSANAVSADVATPPIKPIDKAAAALEVTPNSAPVMGFEAPTDHKFATPWQLQHQQMARAAWRYFEQQYQPATGLINSVAGYTKTTLWDVASAIAGTVAAKQIGLLSLPQMEARLRPLLATLASWPLYREWLPNRSYHTDSGLPVVRRHEVGANGSGWSVLDIARTLGWLVIVARRYPQLQPQVEAIRHYWRTDLLVAKGQLQGARWERNGERRYQEGRLGYEQYAAVALALWGQAAPVALKPHRDERHWLAGVALLKDNRPRPFFTSDPYYLAQLEFGVAAAPMQAEIHAIWQAHQRHYQQHQRLYCYGEDAIAWPPWFVYNNVHYHGTAWHSTDHQGRATTEQQDLSAKCAVAWAVLSHGSYSKALWQVLEKLYGQHGWYSGIMRDGRINRSQNLNTNGIILTALAYLHGGKRSLLPTP